MIPLEYSRPAGFSTEAMVVAVLARKNFGFQPSSPTFRIACADPFGAAQEKKMSAPESFNATICESIEGSLNFGLYAADGPQVGFTRVVTDRATFAWICDIYVLPGHRGRGLSKWLMETVKAHPDLQGLRRWLLATSDAHGLYAQYGFVPADAGRMMEIRDVDIYRRQRQSPRANNQSE